MRKLSGIVLATTLAAVASGDVYKDANDIEWTFTASGSNATLGNGSDACIATSTSVDAAKIPWKFTKDNTTYTVTAIAKKAFYDCTKLTGTLTIPDAVTSIGESAFQYCRGLTKIASLGGVTVLNGYTFNNATGLPGSDYPDMSKLKQAQKYEFSYCKMGGEVHLDSFTGNIYCDHMFNGAQITKVYFPRAPFNLLSNFLFMDCPNLKAVYVPGPDSSGASLIRRTGFFSNCSALKVFLAGPRTWISTTYGASDKNMFNNMTGVLIFVPAGKAESGASWDDLENYVAGNTITHYGADQDLNLEFNHSTRTITATVKCETVLVNLLKAAPYFKSEFGYNTKVIMPEAIEVEEGALSADMLAGVSFNTLSFNVKTQGQLDMVLNATREIDAPLGIDPTGAKVKLVLPANRKAWIYTDGAGEYSPHINGTVISLY